jgi:hypothetical protein
VIVFQGGAKVLIDNGMRGNTVGSVEMPDGTDMTLAAFLRSTLVDSVNLGTDSDSRSLAGGKSADMLSSSDGHARLEGAGGEASASLRRNGSRAAHAAGLARE